MAFKCKGDWKSWVGQKFPPQGDPNDGDLVFGSVNAAGKFKGKHKKQKDFKIENGLCKETVSEHTTGFDTDEGFRYDGKITTKFFDGRDRDVAEGKRRTSAKTSAKSKKGAKFQDEDWVAVKVGL